ncbi:tRNA epoxyqueuosine(34) reductase QueG [Neptuniibacter sp. 2_MG-2023]|uniref:tRNA epoxyqueuosine(34) reductase QueG n=1 Tax=Neptuniibacter sp. 2_MG-2023 TaxID=3062671 RepID=UPI0026E2B170|nr:tRNA epoxyqueuosine(34) reductase QueG [Neptuniibacter sp. 2_MG-2023]MDO6515100.1 tRNA epoxyqueuosine(34) reductase QueG [Neptuniibacter sp. 2_MG-2023]
MPDKPSHTLATLAQKIKSWAKELGFQQCGITDCDLSAERAHYEQWIEAGYHGEMGYLNNHLDKRFSADSLLPGTQRIICVRMDYLPPDTAAVDLLDDGKHAYISRYTLGRDYHKLIRKRLTQLGKKIDDEVGETVFRAFVDSAPLLERPLAEKAGLGWRGKHTLILNREAGSMFFLGELLIDLPLPIDQPSTEEHCGKCTACLDVCPTQAFPQPHLLDARKCISYLTIELSGSIPEELRPKMGNRIFGCDDCQLICPWNRFADFTHEQDFHPRQKLDKSELIELFNWDEPTFLKKTEGSAIRRTGHIGWLRNIAVALGNSDGGENVINALKAKLSHSSEIVQEHSLWALNRLATKRTEGALPIHTHSRRNKIKF